MITILLSLARREAFFSLVKSQELICFFAVIEYEQSLFPLALTDSRSKKNTRAITKMTSRGRNVTRATIHVRHVSTRQAIFALFCFCQTIPERRERLLVIYCSDGQLRNNVNKLRLLGSKWALIKTLLGAGRERPWERGCFKQRSKVLKKEVLVLWRGTGGGRPGEKGAGGVRGAGSEVSKVAESGRERDKLHNIAQNFANFARGGSQQIQGRNPWTGTKIIFGVREVKTPCPLPQYLLIK